MERVKQIKVANRKLYPRQTQGKLTGFQINIPSSFSGMLEPNKYYTITLELEEE